MSAPEYTSADRRRDMAHGSDEPDPGAEDTLQRIFGEGERDERGKADPATARQTARAVRADKTGGGEKDSAA